MKLCFFCLLLFTTFALVHPIYFQQKAYKESEELWSNQENNSDQKFNTYLFDKQVIKKTRESDFSFISSESEVLGFLEFPTVRIPTSAIYKEKTNESFFQYKVDAFLITEKNGNFVIYLNDQWKNQALLLNLAQLRVGDCFFLRVGQQKIAYQIITKRKEYVQGNLKNTSNKQLLSLEMKDMTGFTDKYVVFKCKQLSNEPLEKRNTTSRIIFSYQFFIGGFLLLNGTFFAWLILNYQRYSRQAHSKSFRSSREGYIKLRNLLQITRGYYIILGLIMLFFLLLVLSRVF